MKSSVGIPVVANGDIKTEQDVARVCEETGVDGECNMCRVHREHVQGEDELSSEVWTGGAGIW